MTYFSQCIRQALKIGIKNPLNSVITNQLNMTTPRFSGLYIYRKWDTSYLNERVILETPINNKRNATFKSYKSTETIYGGRTILMLRSFLRSLHDSKRHIMRIRSKQNRQGTKWESVRVKRKNNWPEQQYQWEGEWGEPQFHACFDADHRVQTTWWNSFYIDARVLHPSILRTLFQNPRFQYRHRRVWYYCTSSTIASYGVRAIAVVAGTKYGYLLFLLLWLKTIGDENWGRKMMMLRREKIGEDERRKGKCGGIKCQLKTKKKY